MAEAVGSSVSSMLEDQYSRLAEQRQQRKADREKQRLYDATKQRPLKVSQFDLLNIGRTAPSLIQTELMRQPALWETSNLDDIKDAMEDVALALKSLDVFDEVSSIIKPSEEGVGFCVVEIRLKEKKALHITAGSFMSTNGEGSGEVQLALRNRLGYAESIQLAYERGMRGSNEMNLSVTKPRPAAAPVDAGVRLSQTHRSVLESSSFTERSRAVILSLSSQDRAHSIAYEAGLRTITDPSRAASNMVARHLGHSLKSAVQYTFRHDRLFALGDGQIGTLQLKSTTEVAGLAGGVGVARFARQHMQGHLTVSLPDTTAFLSLGVGAGVMAPLGRGAAGSPSSISDRFFLGGPASLRGFDISGVGPAAERRQRQPPPAMPSEGAKSPSQSGSVGARPQYDFLGGDMYATAMAAVNFNLPFASTTALGLRGHVFMNVGNTVLLAGMGRPLNEALGNFRRGIRCTTGVGIVLPIPGMGNFEVNYCCPLRFQATDRVHHGLQIGFAPHIH